MTFPASSASLTSTWQEMQQLASRIKSSANGVLTDLDNQVNSKYMLDLHRRMIGAKLKLSAFMATPGLAQHAKDQLDNQAFDLGAACAQIISAIDGIQSFIQDFFPKTAEGYLLERKFSSTGFTDRTFQPAELADLKPLVQALIDSID